MQVASGRRFPSADRSIQRQGSSPELLCLTGPSEAVLPSRAMHMRDAGLEAVQPFERISFLFPHVYNPCWGIPFCFLPPFLLFQDLFVAKADLQKKGEADLAPAGSLTPGPVCLVSWIWFPSLLSFILWDTHSFILFLSSAIHLCLPGPASFVAISPSSV